MLSNIFCWLIITVFIMRVTGRVSEILQETIPKDCAEVQAVHPLNPNVPSGMYTISPIPGNPIAVQCDMERDGGGWTVFQQRGLPLTEGARGRQDFFLNWTDYEQGFGNPAVDYWMGLPHISALTSLHESELYVELTDWEGEVRFARYATFMVGNTQGKYRLDVGGYSGNAGDSMNYQNGMMFTTRDQDNDAVPALNCAESYFGAWWYSTCHASNPNGLYAADGSNGTMPYGIGMVWFHWKGHYYSLKEVRMMTRPKSYGLRT